jgi:hypothetical protein
MKNIHVKVAVAKVIPALEGKVAQAKKAHAENDKLRKAWTTANEKWNTALAKAIVKVGTVDSVHENGRWWSKNDRMFDVRFTVPQDATLPERPIDPEYEIPSISSVDIADIENIIRVLKLTDDEYVSASIFKKFSQFL